MAMTMRVRWATLSPISTWRKAALLTVALTLAAVSQTAGCSFSSCGQAGCESLLELDLAAVLDDDSAQGLSIETCFLDGSICQPEHVDSATQTVSVPLPRSEQLAVELAKGESIRVSVQLSNGGNLIATASGDVVFAEAEGRGQGTAQSICRAPCFGASVVLDDRGGLSQV